MEPRRSYSLGLYEKALPPAIELEKMLSETKRLGFDWLEISVDESDHRLSRLDWTAAQKRALKEAIHRTGVPIRTMCLSGHRRFPLGASESETCRRSLEIMRKAIDFAVECGIAVIQLAGYDVYYEPSTDVTRGRFAENLRTSAEMAAEAGVVLAFETMETPFMDTVEKAMRYVTEIGSPWLGLYPDIGNLHNAAILYDHSITNDMAKGAGHIFAIHLKETEPGIYRDMRFGTGCTPFEECIRSAADMGVRMFTGEFWYQDGQDYEREVSFASAFLRSILDSVFASDI